MIGLIIFVIILPILINFIIDCVSKDLQNWIVETGKRIKNEN